MKSHDKEVTVGLYRHFKGSYYYLERFCKEGKDIYCLYFNVCKPLDGTFVREISTWFDTTVKNRKGNDVEIVSLIENITGQTHRFEKVWDLNFQIESVETRRLIAELDTRKDSPFRDLDIEGLQSAVADRTYVCANIVMDEMRNLVAFNDLDSAREYRDKHNRLDKPVKIFKRVFIEEE